MKLEKLNVPKACRMGLCALLLIALPAAAPAQGQGDKLGSYLTLSTSDIRARTMEIIRGSMNFTEEEGKAFWPLYGKYEQESGALNDRMIAIITDYQANVKTLSNEKANRLSEEVLELDAKKVQLNKKYYKEFSKILPSIRVLQFFQLARRIDTLLSMRIASILPMIGEDW
jgi:hypothetical protein